MKPNGSLAKLVIRDLAKWSGLTFKHPDRLTRDEANQVEAWARTQPQVVKSWTNKNDPENSSVRLYATMVRHFQADHPQAADGEPAPWPAIPGTGRQPTDADPFAHLSAEEAEARLEWAKTVPEYRDAYLNKAHPLHAQLVQETAMLQAIITPPPTVLDAVPATAPSAPTPAPATPSAAPAGADHKAAIAELMRHPAYRDGRHPEHRQLVDQVRQAYQRAYPDPAASASPSAPAAVAASAPSPVADAKSRIAALTHHEAYLNPKHAEHRAIVDQVTQAYQQAYPEPAAPAAPAPTPAA